VRSSATEHTCVYVSIRAHEVEARELIASALCEPTNNRSYLPMRNEQSLTFTYAYALAHELLPANKQSLLFTCPHAPINLSAYVRAYAHVYARMRTYAAVYMRG
jgi:hypothetical protein